MRLFNKAALAAVALAMISPAHAEPLISEIKGGVMDHDVNFLGSSKEDGLNVNMEVLFATPDILRPLWAPRPHVGVHINTAGDTSQAYAGLTWTLRSERFPIWAAASFGGSIHNGETGRGDRDEKELGSRALFRESVEVGYDINQRLNVSLIFDHVSNASLADENEGLNNFGVRFGYRF